MSSSIILNVDDHEPGRYARTRLLTQSGYTVHEAANGNLALDMVSSLRPSLVLLDVNLPDMSGMEVCRRIKTNPSTARTFVLQMSASAIAPSDRVSGLDNGADSYLIEPVHPDVLLATIRALLRVRQAEEQMQETNEELKNINARLEEVNASLARSNEDLDRFAHLVSHDLQEPLRTVSSFASLLERRFRGQLNEEADQFLEYIQQGTARMALLIQKLLVYAHAGRSEKSLNPVNMEEVLDWVLNDLAQSIAESDAVVTHDPLPTVLGDHTQLTQLLQNLISNGLKYRQPEQPPQIHISAEKKSASFVQFSVADQGIGIPPEYHSRIFAPFQRLHGSEIPGSGIGLASCQRIVEAHRGRIWVESDGTGTGTTFRFLLRSANPNGALSTP